MPIKKYESRFDEETIVLNLPEKSIRIAFHGGGRYPKKHGGVYITDKPEIQKALESRNDFAKRWKILYSEATREELKKLEPINIDQIPLNEEKKLVGTTLTEYSTFQQVRNYLLKTYPMTTFSELRSKENTKKFAADHHLNFPNWIE